MFTRWQIPLLHSNGSKVLPAQNPTPCLPLPRDVSVRLCVNYNLHANGSGDARSAVFTRHTAALHAAETWDGQTAVWWSPPLPNLRAGVLAWVGSFIHKLFIAPFLRLARCGECGG